MTLSFFVRSFLLICRFQDDGKRTMARMTVDM
jgi:hypothetical protein